MKLLEAIQRSAEFLSRKGVDSPRLQAELLLAHLLRIQRMQLYLNFERVLERNELDAYRELIRRRGQREPLQQIVGATSFCGYEIEVDQHVLVPRPETELLAEEGWKFLSELAKTMPGQPLSVLDFGTGSGCIAVALAAKCPECCLLAIDSSTEALGLARKNAERLGVAPQIRFLQASSLATAELTRGFHLIISNPPYVPSGEIEHLQPEVKDYEPHGALDGGPDGLKFYRQLAGEARGLLAPNGKIMLEFGDEQGEALRKTFEDQNWIVEGVIEDYTRRPRILIASTHG